MKKVKLTEKTAERLEKYLEVETKIKENLANAESQKNELLLTFLETSKVDLEKFSIKSYDKETKELVLDEIKDKE